MNKKTQNELPWHPDFRDVSALPDLKVVRSSFFINFAPLVVAVALLGYWIFIEIQIGSLSGAIASHQGEIALHEKTNAELLRQSAEFEKWAKNINEIQGFVGVPFKSSDFLAAIGSVRPAQMTLTQLSYNIEARKEPDKKQGDKKIPGKAFAVYNVTVVGSMSGTAQQATRAVSAFRDKLEELPLFKGLTFNVKPVLKTFSRDKSLDVYSFTLNLEVRL